MPTNPNTQRKAAGVMEGEHANTDRNTQQQEKQPTKEGDQSQTNLMSLNGDKTHNILKNYTNLVNRLKQSQREKEGDIITEYLPFDQPSENDKDSKQEF